MTPEDSEAAAELADTLRSAGVNVALGMKHKDRSDHLKTALKLGIPFFAAYGEKEKSAAALMLKEFSTEKEETVSLDKLASRLLS
jgi:histidyl-tRNA synthetase